MVITFGNATVQRLDFDCQLAERLNHLRFYKITDCLLRIHQGRLFVNRLLAYSPDKNPIEKLWKNTKKEVTHCRYFPTLEDLRTEVLGAFEQYLRDSSKVLYVMQKLRRQVRFV